MWLRRFCAAGPIELPGWVDNGGTVGAILPVEAAEEDDKLLFAVRLVANDERLTERADEVAEAAVVGGG